MYIYIYIYIYMYIYHLYTHTHTHTHTRTRAHVRTLMHTWSRKKERKSHAHTTYTHTHYGSRGQVRLLHKNCKKMWCNWQNLQRSILGHQVLRLHLCPRFKFSILNMLMCEHGFLESVAVYLMVEVSSCWRILLLMQDETRYGVASASRIDKIKGLFFKRALQKRQYSAKETYNCIDPTDRSQPHNGVFPIQIFAECCSVLQCNAMSCSVL